MPHPMENTLLYRLWQAPFAERKLAPFLADNDPRAVRRVLDVGCGPGTNAAHFTGRDYLGIDLNPDYIGHARRRFPGLRFEVADVTALGPGSPVTPGYDCILVNSLLHHLPDAESSRLLRHLESLLAPDGHVHILDLVLPPRPSLARLLARLDRGRWPRPLAHWQLLFEACFTPVRFQPYPLGALGVELWSMVYFKGGRRIP